MGITTQMRKIVQPKKNRLIIVFILICSFSALVFVVSRVNMVNPVGPKTLSDSTDNSGNKIIIDFETRQYLDPATLHTVSTDVSLSGNKSCVLLSKKSYSAAIILDMDKLNTESLADLNLNYWYYPMTKNIDLMMVVSVFDKDFKTQLFWDSHHLTSTQAESDSWSKTGKKFHIPDSLMQKNNKLKIYAINNIDASPIYLDDIELDFSGNINTGGFSRSKNIDFENLQGKGISNLQAYQGTQSSVASGNDSYSYLYSCPMSDFDLNNADQLNYRFYFMNEKELVNFVLVFSIKDNKGNTVHWYGHHINQTNPVKSWTKMQGYMPIPTEACKPGNTMEIYGWNRNDNTVYTDDIYFVLKSNKDIKMGNEVLCDLTKEPNFAPKINQPPYQNIILHKASANHLWLGNQITQIQYCMTARILSNTYDQVVAGNQPAELSCYYIENGSLHAAPIGLGTELSTNSFLIPCDINTDGTDEILAFDNNNKKLICYSMTGNVKSLKAQKNYGIDYSKIGGFEDVRLGCKVLGTDGKQACMIISNSGKAGILYTTSGSTVFEPMAGDFGNITRVFSGDLINDKPGPEIVLLGGAENSCSYSIYHAEGKWPHFKIASLVTGRNGKAGYDGLSNTSEYFIGNFKSGTPANLLMLDRAWRFDLKLIELNKDHYEIIRNVDFSGFTDYNNPKYYPATAIACGNFAGDPHSEVMVFSFSEKYSAISSGSLRKNHSFFTPKVEVYEFK